MTTRPVFVPKTKSVGVDVVDVAFEWNRGLAMSQMRKNVQALHAAAAQALPGRPLLEISSRSSCEYGILLSAFNLSWISGRRRMTVESIYQASKVFEGGVGPFPSMFSENPKIVRDYVREKAKGLKITGFSTGKELWPLNPTRLFYDWVYCKVVHNNPTLVAAANRFGGFTDIAFNPRRSLNCQAYAIALYLSLKANGVLLDALKDRMSFESVHPNETVALNKDGYKRFSGKRVVQGRLDL